MITTAERRRPPILAIAIALSVVLHVIGFLLYSGYAHAWLVAVRRSAEPKPTDDMVALSDRITLEKRTVPREAHRLPPPSVPQPVPPQAVRPQPIQPRPEVVQATSRPEPVRTPRAAPTAAQRREIAHVVPRAPAEPAAHATQPPAEKTVSAVPPATGAPRAGAPGRFTPNDIARLNAMMKQTIARAESDQSNVRPPKAPAATMKKYDLVMSGTPADLTRAQGYVTPLHVRTDRTRRLNIYYVEVRIVWPDGFSEIVNLPWQVELPIGNDPLLRPGSFPYTEIGPPPGYVLPHPFQLSRTLCLYYREECRALIDAEERNGGAPVAN